MLPGLLLMGFVLAVTVFLAVEASGTFDSYLYFFLVPWIFALAVVFITPSAILLYQGKFSFANPIVFATFSYFFPAFVLGGIALAAGWSQPYFVAFIQDARYNLPYTIILIMLGFSGLSVGYFLPVGAKIGTWVARLLPVANYKSTAYFFPGLLLLALGIFNSIFALALGIIGFQKVDQISSYDGLIFLTTLFWTQANFLLWCVIFAQKRLNILQAIVAGVLITTSVIKALFSGYRGSIILTFSAIAIAYIVSGRVFRLKQIMIASSLLFVLMILGMIYGTTFRQVKGSEAAEDLGLYTENIFTTFDQIGRNDNVNLLQFAFANMAERIDALSPLAVVVSNYEQLAPYEESYGLDNNIWKDTTTFFIPRVLWPDKPVASELRKYSDLYFNYGESSFTITPIGDLLRNFGVLGIPVGMLLLGIALRVIYRALIDDQPIVVWRATLYFMLLSAVTYDAFYGSIAPALFKNGAAAVVGILIVNTLARYVRFKRK